MTGFMPPPRRQAPREQAMPRPVAPPPTAVAPPAAAVLRATSAVPVAAAVAGPPPPAPATAPAPPPATAVPPPRVPAAPAPPSPPRPATARQARRPSRLVLPIVAGELALVLVLVTLDRSWPAIVVVACGAALLGAFAAARVRGRLLCQWVVVAGRFLLRERAADLPDEQVGAALLRLLRPGARTTTGDAFVVSDAAGVATVLRPESGRRDPGPPVLAPRDLLPDADEALAYAVQVIHHASVDRSQPPRVWLTLQALRTATVWADDDVQAALANVVRRVRRRLRRAEVPFRTLTEEETLRSYAALAHVNSGRGHVREEWWLWHSGPIRQATFRVDGWDGLTPSAAARLVRWFLAAAPDTAVTLSCTAHHGPVSPGEAVVGAVLRIATSKPEALDAAVTDMARLADEVGVALVRLDGLHARGVAATLPGGVTEVD